ncbi:hypothetical protein DIPPA_64590, partial [Diplonema papillatum]
MRPCAAAVFLSVVTAWAEGTADELRQTFINSRCSVGECTDAHDLPAALSSSQLITIESIALRSTSTGWTFLLALTSHKDGASESHVVCNGNGCLRAEKFTMTSSWNQSTSWSLDVVATNTTDQPDPFEVQGSAWLCGTLSCAGGAAKVLSDWRGPLMWAGISFPFILIALVLYRRCASRHSGGGDGVRGSRVQSVASLTHLWYNTADLNTPVANRSASWWQASERDSIPSHPYFDDDPERAPLSTTKKRTCEAMS